MSYKVTEDGTLHADCIWASGLRVETKRRQVSSFVYVVARWGGKCVAFPTSSEMRVYEIPPGMFGLETEE